MQDGFSDTSFLIYTDGACSGNPGPGGWGAIVSQPGQWIVELGGGDPATTNNQMELAAVIESMKAFLSMKNKSLCKELFIFTDSVYVIRGITQWIWGWKKSGWVNQEGKAVANRNYWEALQSAVQEMKNNGIELKWTYVRGHQGTHGNERCDEIAVAYSKNQYVELYSGTSLNYFFDITIYPKTEPLPEMKKVGAISGPAKKSWYIVINGSQKMTFQTWSDCEAAVKGRSGVKFKKVSSTEEEETVLKQWGYKGS